MSSDKRYTLVYRNEDGTAQTLRLWTLEDAQRRLAELNQTEAASDGTWTIHEVIRRKS